MPGATLSIAYETRPYTGGALANAAAYETNWLSLIAANPLPPAGYGATSLAAWSGASNQVTFPGGSANDVAYHATVTFSVAPLEAGTWNFRFGIDFGLGGVAFLDGTVLDFRNTDMWWNGSFADPLQQLSGSRSLAAGNHVFQIYGIDACCNGVTVAQFQTPGGTFQTFSTVPEPSGGLLSSLGLLAIAMGQYHRRSR